MTKEYLVLLLLLHFQLSVAVNYINVKEYGAKSNGKTDSSKAFESAWVAACATSSSATIYVPQGKYLLRSANFNGKSCMSKDITIRIDGTILAPSDYKVNGNAGNWIKFERVTGLSIYGGTLDGQGSALWSCKNSANNNCPKGATTLGVYNSNNIVISGLTSVNSQMFHILLDGCDNAKLTGVKVSAPGNSPNTDGIHLQSSSGVTILNSYIGTGDDCVSIGPDNSNLWIENIACGPGHGISIGSLGWDLQEAGVENVTVKTATFSGTENGLRVKTWARPSNSFVKDILFQHVVMKNVENPIIIDQKYCPNHGNCPQQSSGVKIDGITYQDIHGTSATQVAVKFDCSNTNPCNSITMEDVNLSYKDHPTESSCVNAGGRASGLQIPDSCLKF